MTKEQIRDFTFRVSQENDSGLVIILFDIELVYLNDALNAYAEKNIDDFIFNVEAAKRTLSELMNAMNTNDANALRVLSILRHIFSKLVSSSVRKEPQELDRCISMLQKIKTIFEAIHKQDSSGPVMRNAHQIYAGLTYGKGTLTESYGNVDYSNRGYKI